MSVFVQKNQKALNYSSQQIEIWKIRLARNKEDEPQEKNLEKIHRNWRFR